VVDVSYLPGSKLPTFTVLLFVDTFTSVFLDKKDQEVKIVEISVRDPKLIISDPDPQIENQEFRIRIQIRILDPDPSVTRDGEIKLTILVIMKTKMG